MFKILEAYLHISFLNIKHIHPWEVVGPSIIHRDGCAGLRIEPWIAVIFDMTLGAQKIGIEFVEKSNSAEGFAISLKFDLGHGHFFTLFFIVRIRSFFPIHNSLNQGIAHHPWFCCMGIMTAKEKVPQDGIR